MTLFKMADDMSQDILACQECFYKDSQIITP